MPNEENLFAKKDDVSIFVRNNINLSIKVLDAEVDRCIDSSDLTKCNRYFYYKNKNGIPFRLDQMAKRPIVEKWIRIFQTNKLFNIISSTYYCRDIKHNLTGTLDIIVRVNDNPRNPLAIIVKSKSSDEFKEIKEGKVPRKDIVEIMANMWMAEIVDGILIYENCQDMSFEVFHIVPDKYLINSLKAKCLEIAKIKDELQNKPYDKISGECERCHYKIECWGEDKNA